MSRFISLVICVSALSASLIPSRAWSAESEGRKLAVFRDFETETPGRRNPITYHSWTAAQRQNAERYSQIEIIADASFGKHCCKLTVSDQLPWGNRNAYRALTIGPDYLPPEADALRLKVKVLQGSFRLTVGSPTVYFGHSDVLAEAQDVKVSDDWQTLEFSLHHELSRNFRRARFGRQSPVIYYTRWIQEPLYLNIVQPSAGEILLDQVELIARGNGRAYPRFAADQIETVAELADFEQEREMQKAFTFLQEPIDLTKPPHLVRPDWKPPVLKRVPRKDTGRFALSIEHRGTEEVCFAGIKIAGHRDANALAITMHAAHDGGNPEVVLDFITYVTPAGRQERFPWPQFRAPEDWRQDARAFTYYLDQQRASAADYAFYHVRRTLPNGRWTTLVLPFADFICAYGQRQCEEMFRQQLPLQGENLLSLGLVTPYGQRREPTRLLIDDVSLVRVPGEPAELRSFPQTAPRVRQDQDKRPRPGG